MALVHALGQRSGQEGARHAAQGAQHLEGAVETGPFRVRHIGLGGGNADVVAGDPQHPGDEKGQGHEGDGEIQLNGRIQSHHNVHAQGDTELQVGGKMHLVVDEAADEPPNDRSVGDDGIQGHRRHRPHDIQVGVAAEKGQVQGTAAASGKVAHGEVQRHRQ